MSILFSISKKFADKIQFISLPVARIEKECENCNREFSVKFYKNSRTKEKYFLGDCKCGYRFFLSPKDCEVLQPIDKFYKKLFELYYGYDPAIPFIKDEEERIKQKEKFEEQREISQQQRVKSGQLKTRTLREVKKIAEDRGLG